MARETWYVLESGAPVDPNEVAPNDEGLLCHKLGPVAYHPTGVPKSMGVDPEEERAKARPAPKSEPKVGYETRESRAR